MNPNPILIGTRGSALALAQAGAVADRLAQAHPGRSFALQRITTRGDRDLTRALPAIGGKGLFTAEIEDALRGGEIQLAVHSLKDLPTELPEGLCVAAVPEREDARDALISRAGVGLDELPKGSRVGTSSLRRRAQLLAARPDLEVVDMRGNVDTRLGKLRAGHVDAIVLAAAGLARLGRLGEATELLAPEVMAPAVGQGALGVEAVTGSEAAALAAAIADADTTACVRAERALLAALGGGCHVPIGGHARVDDQGRVRLTGLVAATNGARVVRAEIEGAAADAEALGRRLAEQLIQRGAADILAAAAQSLEHDHGR